MRSLLKPAAALPGLLLIGAVAAVAAQTSQSAPLPDTPRFSTESIDAGRDQFHRTCAQCHGRNMVNAGTTVYDLRKFPQDQPERFLNSVTHGKGNMPSFAEALSQAQIDVLWAYVGSRGGKEP